MSTSEKITFEADTDNKTIVIGELRIRQGENTFSEHLIRKYGIDCLPFVKMPYGWRKEIKQTEAFVKTKFKKKEEYEKDLDEARVREIVKSAEPAWSPVHISSMDAVRAKKVLAEQNDVKKLVELLQFTTTKRDVRELVVARIRELDPGNTFLKNPDKDMSTSNKD